ncbi:MAG: hypothetical protein ING19_11335 [Azospirillum sp.]|nr:hypothetical protein [Azospirillum sp.]
MREILRAVAEIPDGLTMAAIPGGENELERAILEDIVATKSFRFKDPPQALKDVKFRYDAAAGKLEILANLGDDPTLDYVRVGSGASLMRDVDPGNDWNRATIDLVARLLAIGLIDEVVPGKILRPVVLLYLKPFPVPEDSVDEFIDSVIDAVQRWRPRKIVDARRFDAEMRSAIERLTATGIPLSSLATRKAFEATLQKEFVRNALRMEMWRKLWRWLGEVRRTVEKMRQLGAVSADQKNAGELGNMIDAICRAEKTVQIHVKNANILATKALKSNDFYLDAIPFATYARSNRRVLEEIFETADAWVAGVEALPQSATMAEIQAFFKKQSGKVRGFLAMPVPGEFPD